MYLDASALTKLIILEPETLALQEVVRGRQLISSRVAVVEVTKAVARADPTADAQMVLSRLSFIELDGDLAIIAGTTGGAALRALDALHVASALRVAREIELFITYDTRQADSAVAAGLRVVSPR